MPTKILIADADSIFRAGLHSLFANDPAFSVVGEAGDPQDTLDQAIKLAPDMIVMDVVFSGASALESIQAILRAHRQARLVILTSLDSDEYMFEAIRCGALGYLIKGLPWPKLLQALVGVLNGELALSRRMTARLARRLQLFTTATNGLEARAISQLTVREQDILACLGEGHSNREIAKLLTLSTHTVKVHVRHILAKLRVKNRAQAREVARRYQLAVPVTAASPNGHEHE